MRPVIMHVEGQSREFDSLAEAIEWSNEVLADKPRVNGHTEDRSPPSERVTLTIPTWAKAELRRTKKATAVPMSAQVRAWWLKGATGR